LLVIPDIRRVSARNPIFVASFVASFVDKARDKARDKDVTQMYRMLYRNDLIRTTKRVHVQANASVLRRPKPSLARPGTGYRSTTCEPQIDECPVPIFEVNAAFAERFLHDSNLFNRQSAVRSIRIPASLRKKKRNPNA